MEKKREKKKRKMEEEEDATTPPASSTEGGGGFKTMDESVATNIRSVIDPFIKRDTGNIILVVASSKSGKSTFITKVLLPIFKKSNGFITTFMSPNYDAEPIRAMIVENVIGKPNSPQDFKTDMLYDSKEWIFLKRGFDATYCGKIYGTRLELNDRYGEAKIVNDFRFVLALDDAIDIGGSLIRKVCMTWRNRNISWIQLVQDFTCIDCACRNSAPITVWGYENTPKRQKVIVEDYLAPFIPGANTREKMIQFVNMTKNKRFIFLNNEERIAIHLDTNTGVCTPLPELSTVADHEYSSAQILREPTNAVQDFSGGGILETLPVNEKKGGEQQQQGNKKKRKRNKTK
jgi:hypothetical protein